MNTWRERWGILWNTELPRFVRLLYFIMRVMTGETTRSECEKARSWLIRLEVPLQNKLNLFIHYIEVLYFP